MNEQRNNGRGIFYGVIGVATLVVAIIGATFAYFTATASNNVITGNMAQVSLSLNVEKVTNVDISKGGMIPMSNGMIEQAVNKGKSELTPAEDDGDATVTNICVDDNGNAVCQIYKITLTNSSSAGQFVDGYVALRGGSGEPTDLTLTTKVKDAAKDTNENGVCDSDETGCEMVPDDVYTYDPLALKNAARETVTYGTTMRWAQVFVDTTKTSTQNNGTTYYTTKGTQTLGAASETVTFTTALGSATDAKDLANIRTQKAYMVPATGTDANNNGICDTGESGCTPGTANPEGVLTSVSIAGNYYDAIGTNYIRLSNHKWGDGTTPETYDRTADITSALVFNHSVAAGQPADYYVVVWLSETGTNQTAGATVMGGADGKTEITNPAAANFFVGDVTFVSAQGSEVSATFSGYTRVSSQ